MGVKYLGDYGSDGACLGRAAADKVGFYGTTPIIKPTVTLGAGTTTTLLAADVLAIRTALVALGLVAAG